MSGGWSTRVEMERPPCDTHDALIAVASGPHIMSMFTEEEMFTPRHVGTASREDLLSSMQFAKGVHPCTGLGVDPEHRCGSCGYNVGGRCVFVDGESTPVRATWPACTVWLGRP